jgi:hypothetical protein
MRVLTVLRPLEGVIASGECGCERGTLYTARGRGPLGSAMHIRADPYVTAKDGATWRDTGDPPYGLLNAPHGP